MKESVKLHPFMKRAINALIGHLMGEKLDFMPEEKSAFFEILRFCAYVYPWLWLRAPYVEDTAHLDTWLLKCIKSYKT